MPGTASEASAHPEGRRSKTRPIGIPSFEDKVLQRAVAIVLEAIYEQEFFDCSFGFRPNRSCATGCSAARSTTWGRSLRGYMVLKRQTAKGRRHRALKAGGAVVSGESAPVDRRAATQREPSSCGGTTGMQVAQPPLAESSDDLGSLLRAPETLPAGAASRGAQRVSRSEPVDRRADAGIPHVRIRSGSPGGEIPRGDPTPRSEAPYDERVSAKGTSPKVNGFGQRGVRRPRRARGEGAPVT